MGVRKSYMPCVVYSALVLPVGSASGLSLRGGAVHAWAVRAGSGLCDLSTCTDTIVHCAHALRMLCA